MRDLVIYGAGGFGTEALEVAEEINRDGTQWNILGFIDDDAQKHGDAVCDYPVLGGRQWLAGRNLSIAICLGQPRLRRKIAIELAVQREVTFATLIHPSVVISRRSTVGAGSVVFAGGVVATNTQIGEHVLIGRNASVGHDLQIGDFVNIFPSASISGHSQIGEGTEVGSNATVIPMKHIGNWSVIGAGAVVTSDLPDNITAVGMPATIIKQREKDWHDKA